MIMYGGTGQLDEGEVNVYKRYEMNDREKSEWMREKRDKVRDGLYCHD